MEAKRAQVVAALPQQCGANSLSLREVMDVEHLDRAGLWVVGGVSLNLAGFLPGPGQPIVDKLAADLDENLVRVVQPVLADRFADFEGTIEVVSRVALRSRPPTRSLGAIGF